MDGHTMVERDDSRVSHPLLGRALQKTKYIKTMKGLLHWAVCIVCICQGAFSGAVGSQSQRRNPETAAAIRPQELFQQAEKDLQRGQKEAALRIFRGLERDLPKSTKLELLMGTILANHECYAEAQPFFAKALALEPGLFDACYNSALAYLRVDRPGKAVEILNQVRPQDQERGDYRNLLGNAYWKLGDVSKAAAELQGAYLLEPSNEGYYLDAGSFFLEHYTPRAATEIFQAGLVRLPDSARLHFAVAISLLIVETWDKATEHLEQALAKEPGFLPARFGLGYAYYNTGQNEKAVRTLRDYIRLVPRDHNGYYYLALTLRRMGEEENSAEVKQLLERCLELKPNFAPGCVQLAAVCNRQGDSRRAIDLLQRSISLDPKHAAPAHILLATVYRRLGNQAGAEGEAKIAQELLDEEKSTDNPERRQLQYVLQQVRPSE
jgi:predicted Zn-dependent protease